VGIGQVTEDSTAEMIRQDKWVIERWVVKLKTRSTMVTYAEAVHRFRSFCNERQVSLLHASESLFDAWWSVEVARCSISTCNVRLAANRRFYEYAIASGLARFDPTSNATPLKSPKFQANVLCDDKETQELIYLVASMLKKNKGFRFDVEALLSQTSLVEKPKRLRNGRDMNLMNQAKANLHAVVVCSYCGDIGTRRLGPDSKRWHHDHVLPLAKGGPDQLSNIVKSCASCNIQKNLTLWTPIEGTITADGQPFRMLADASLF
jgi:hypothetical protein